MTATDPGQRVPSVLAPGLLLGLGLGGFVDGIFLHQVLQWHHMLSNTQDDRIGIDDYPVDTVAGLEVNTLWDGFFHVATWIAVVVGLALLWRRVTRSSGPWSRHSLLGAVLAGWGLFNLVEGSSTTTCCSSITSDRLATSTTSCSGTSGSSQSVRRSSPSG